MSIVSTLTTLRTAGKAPEPGARVVDLAFAIDGETLPATYAFALEAALIEALPWFADEGQGGVHPIRAPLTDFGLVLSRRVRLVLRIPEERIAAARGLSGQSLAVGDAVLRVGAATERPVVPFATLRSAQVASSAEDEQGFVEAVGFELEALGIEGQLICGRRVEMQDGERHLAGFGLALHDLSPVHSLRLQTHGLGGGRRLGWGLFVQHKIITELGGDPQ